MIATQVLRLIIAVFAAFVVGRLAARAKLPAILGWLIAGMALGPHAVGLLNTPMLEAPWYENSVHILECSVGLMIGTELVWKRIRTFGRQIIITTLTQSLGTFLVVSAAFAVVFHIAGVPLYLAFIFGGIALATAPAPALSIVNEYRTNGPVTKTLIPMAALDDMVGVAVFFSVIAVVASGMSEQRLPVYMIALFMLLPIVIGVAAGLLAGVTLKKDRSSSITALLVIAMILVASGIGFFFNYRVLPRPILNFMLIGMAFSATFSNMVSEERLEVITRAFSPILALSLVVVIINLGAPLDYHLILGAGLFTAIYIVSRAAGKYGGAYFGASITGSPATVRKYLGLTLLPHSGVSLVFTGIAISVLSGPAPESAKIIQGTIAAAAVINEVIAVLVAKQAFKWAGEIREE